MDDETKTRATEDGGGRATAAAIALAALVALAVPALASGGALLDPVRALGLISSCAAPVAAAALVRLARRPVRILAPSIAMALAGPPPEAAPLAPLVAAVALGVLTAIALRRLHAPSPATSDARDPASTPVLVVALADVLLPLAFLATSGPVDSAWMPVVLGMMALVALGIPVLIGWICARAGIAIDRRVVPTLAARREGRVR